MWVRVHATRTLFEAHLARDRLEAEGIPVHIAGEMRPSIAGEIPLPDATVEVKVPQERLIAARAILARIQLDAARDPWRCARCGEENPGEFDLCWKCGAEAA